MRNVLHKEQIKSFLGERPRECNKGDNGKGLLLAGSEGFFGAAIMAATACLRGGIGTLKVLCPEGARPAFHVLPEAMIYRVGPDWTLSDRGLIAARIQEATCLALGPGIGREEAVLEILQALLAAAKPTVVDADGLNALSRLPQAEKRALLHANTVLTPHPGEMSRLTGCSIESIKENMEGMAREWAGRWGCTVLLKGARTAIAGPNGEFAWNESGNAGLAKGGSGDVLTGLILALLGQKLPPFQAACCGSYLLGVSAEEGLRLLRERALMARDVIDAVENTLHILWGEN